jgi:hypothetical protein
LLFRFRISKEGVTEFYFIICNLSSPDIGSKSNDASKVLFGRSVSLSSDWSTVAIRARFNDGNGSYAGHVRVYNIASIETYSTDTITSCGAYTWTNGVTYTTSNTTDTFVNAAGCDSIVTLNLTVQDIIKPTVITQNLTVSLDATGSGSITATQVDNGSTDNCRIATRTLSKYSFDCSEVGSNTMYLIVTDVNGNVDSTSAVITVQDIIKPTVVTTPSNIALGYCDAAYTYPLPTATDNCGVTVTQVAGLASGSVFPVGITTNTFEIKDPSDNTVTTSFTVDIRDRYMPFDTTNMSRCVIMMLRLT